MKLTIYTSILIGINILTLSYGIVEYNNLAIISSIVALFLNSLLLFLELKYN